MKKTFLKTKLCIFLAFVLCLLAFGACTPNTPNNNLQTQEAFVTVDHKNIAMPTSYDASSSQGMLNVHYLCVGQADSIFIELPNGETMLIDAGNQVDADGIVSYIKKLGYDKITYLLATHPHADHIGGMAQAVDSLDIGAVYMPKKQHDTKTFENLLLSIQQKGLKVKTAKAGVTILDDGPLSLTLLAPVKESYKDLNNYSAVLKLTYGENTFLFTGDAETLSENDIITDVKADVLKVGHHGSDTSTGTSFLKKVAPQYAVICVGPDNSYHHPSQAILERLNTAGAQVYRTDINGTVILSSNGKEIKTHCVVPN